MLDPYVERFRSFLQKARETEAAEAKRLLATTYGGYRKFLMGDVNTTAEEPPTDSFYHRNYEGGATGSSRRRAVPAATT